MVKLLFGLVGRGGCGRSCDHAAQAGAVLVVLACGGASDPVQLQSAGVCTHLTGAGSGGRRSCEPQ